MPENTPELPSVFQPGCIGHASAAALVASDNEHLRVNSSSGSEVFFHLDSTACIQGSERGSYQAAEYDQ